MAAPPDRPEELQVRIAVEALARIKFWDASAIVPLAKSFNQLLDLSDLLEERLGTRVELVTVESLSPIFGPHILAEAQDVLRAA